MSGRLSWVWGWGSERRVIFVLGKVRGRVQGVDCPIEVKTKVGPKVRGRGTTPRRGPQDNEVPCVYRLSISIPVETQEDLVSYTGILGKGR